MDSNDRARLSGFTHAHHPICAPLSDDSVAALLGRAVATGQERILDLGCGEGAWLLRALAAHPDVTADGVDINAGGLTTARHSAERLGVDRRLGLHHQPAADFTAAHPYDLVFCVGSTHAFDGLLPTLTAARRHLAPGGRVLIGEGYWQREPDQAALDGFEATREDFDDLPTLVDKVMADGWVPVAGHQSTRPNSTTTSGLGPAPSPSGPSTTRPTRSPPTPPASPTSTATAGCTATAAPSASSPCCCAARTDQIPRPDPTIRSRARRTRGGGHGTRSRRIRRPHRTPWGASSVQDGRERGGGTSAMSRKTTARGQLSPSG